MLKIYKRRLLRLSARTWGHATRSGRKEVTLAAAAKNICCVPAPGIRLLCPCWRVCQTCSIGDGSISDGGMVVSVKMVAPRTVMYNPSSPGYGYLPLGRSLPSPGQRPVLILRFRPYSGPRTKGCAYQLEISQQPYDRGHSRLRGEDVCLRWRNLAIIGGYLERPWQPEQQLGDSRPALGLCLTKKAALLRKLGHTSYNYS